MTTEGLEAFTTLHAPHFFVRLKRLSSCPRSQCLTRVVSVVAVEVFVVSSVVRVRVAVVAVVRLVVRLVDFVAGTVAVAGIAHDGFQFAVLFH